MDGPISIDMPVLRTLGGRIEILIGYWKRADGARNRVKKTILSRVVSYRVGAAADS